MREANHFSTGSVQLTDDEMFLSVSQGFEQGPGIIRDGITAPRMQDPHFVKAVTAANGLAVFTGDVQYTRDAIEQRAGTWTLYHHLKRFLDANGNATKWRVTAIQSCGDLTMNPWHIAYSHQSHLPWLNRKLCALLTRGDPQEPLAERNYRCIVKWNEKARRKGIRSNYQAVDVTIVPSPYGIRLEPVEQSELGTPVTVHDIATLVEFAIAGKPIIERAIRLPLACAVDRFEDVRHIFDLPIVKAKSASGEDINLYFGEYNLFRNQNERRAALGTPVVVKLVNGSWQIEWFNLEKALQERHYRPVRNAPAARGEYRLYPYAADSVEVFFGSSVYPFGALGLRKTGGDLDGHSAELTCLASGGLSARVGNTLEGISITMADFLGCTDAIVLDEGNDTCLVVNPLQDHRPVLDNDALLQKVLAFTHQRLQDDASSDLRGSSAIGLRYLALNGRLVAEVEQDARALAGDVTYDDIFVVPPRRAQIRSVLIFAVDEAKLNGAGREQL